MPIKSITIIKLYIPIKSLYEPLKKYAFLM